jgi:hypothetical protein
VALVAARPEPSEAARRLNLEGVPVTRLDEIQIARDPEPPVESAPPPGQRWIWALGIVAFVAVLAATWYWWPRGEAEAPSPEVARTEPETAATPALPLGSPGDAIDVPPLDETDPLVRELLGRLSSSPALVAWLATDGLVRTFVVAVDNVATGASPAQHLRVLRPAEPFRAETRTGRLVATDATSRRYGRLADAFVSLDPDGLARVYGTLEPRFDEAYRELGHPDGRFDAAVERAIVRLLQTPVPQGDPMLVEAVESYRYAEARLEALTPAQKQLLRLGPDNQRRVHEHLRAVAQALGLDASRLP